MTARSWPAPAKLNLFLHIVGRRADGYHELQTLFQFLDFGDTLTVRLREDGAIARPHGAPGVAEADDLTVRAARALRDRTGVALGCELHVDKRIPLGGGLGGGSSDAATTLVALNTLWRCGLSEDELAALGLTLGADVPVFVRGFAAWAEGVGERLQPAWPHQPWYLVITPDCAVDTRTMYQDPELPRATPRVSWDDYAAGRCRNDFEALVCRRYRPVAKAFDWASRHGHPRLSGSGSSVFVEFHDEAAARAAAARAPAPWHTVVARGLNRSPLKTAVVA